MFYLGKLKAKQVEYEKVNFKNSLILILVDIDWLSQNMTESNRVDLTIPISFSCIL